MFGGSLRVDPPAGRKLDGLQRRSRIPSSLVGDDRDRLVNGLEQICSAARVVCSSEYGCDRLPGNTECAAARVVPAQPMPT